MAPELFKVGSIDEWPPAFPGASTVWIIKGETVELRPRFLTLKTTDQWKASLLDRIQKADRLAWVTWVNSYRGDPWLRRCEPDETKFEVHDAAS